MNTFVLQKPWAPAVRRPGWSPARPALGQQIPGAFLSIDHADVREHLTVSGIALGYGLLAGILYGKGEVLNRVLLGLGAVAFGAAAYTGLKLGLDFKPSKHPGDYIVGNISGVLNGVIAAGAAVAAVSPKLVAKTAPEAVQQALPG